MDKRRMLKFQEAAPKMLYLSKGIEQPIAHCACLHDIVGICFRLIFCQVPPSAHQGPGERWLSIVAAGEVHFADVWQIGKKEDEKESGSNG